MKSAYHYVFHEPYPNKNSQIKGKLHLLIGIFQVAQGHEQNQGI